MVIDNGVPKNLPEMSAHFHQNLSQWQTIDTFSCSPKDWKCNDTFNYSIFYQYIYIYRSRYTLQKYGKYLYEERWRGSEKMHILQKIGNMGTVINGSNCQGIAKRIRG